MGWSAIFTGCVLALCLVACSSGNRPEKPEEVKLLEKYRCISCHSTDGTKAIGPTFKGLYGSRVKVETYGKKREVSADEEYLRRSILNPGADVVRGYSATMPTGYKDEITEEQLSKIIAYLKTL
jgi:cytochrome c oxidase subunit 2